MSIRQKYLGFGVAFALSVLPAAAGPSLDHREGPLVALSHLPDSRVQQKLDSLFYRWDAYELDLPALESQVRQTGRLRLQAGGRQLDLELEPNDLRGPGFRRVLYTAQGPVEEKPSPIATFKGHVAGDPKSSVRLFIQKDFFQGYIRTNEEWLFIDPLMKYARGAAPSKVVIFDDAEVRPEAASLCGAGELAHRVRGTKPREKGASLPDLKALISPPTLGRIDVATEADFEYYSIYGASTNNQIEGVFNQVDGIYQAELALTVRIVYESVWTTSGDPYTSTTSANSLLVEFQNYWNANRTSVARDDAHLFTGRSMDGGVVGIATGYGEICYNLNASYAISANYTPYVTKITAHEVGHLLQAFHDDVSICGGSGPLMCPSIQTNGPNLFSDRSKTDITSWVDRYGSCLDRLGMTYYTILTSQTPDTAICGVGVYEAGNRFSSTQDGYVTALRFWKDAGETGTHVGNLWTNGGVLLASVTFTNETSSGWQEQYLPFRVKITAGASYWVTYNANTCQDKTGCGLGTPITHGPLTASAGAYSNANGGGTFPTNSSCSNFFADVYFTP